MSAFQRFELLDLYSHYLYGDTFFSNPRLPPIIFPIQSAEDYLDINHFKPNFTPFVHPHYHHSLPFPSPPTDFFDAAEDLIHASAYHRWHGREEANFCVPGLRHRLAALELGLDRAFSPYTDAPEGKWKWSAEIKGPKGKGFDRKYKWTAEAKGTSEKSMKWSVELQGKGKCAPLSRMYTFRASSAAVDDVWEQGKKEKRFAGAMASAVEIDEGVDRQLAARRQALAKRTVHKSKGKKKELSPDDAAVAIQNTFRDHLSRRSMSLHCFRNLAVAKSKLKEIRALFSNFSYRLRIANDAEERQKLSEKIIILLLTIDDIEGPDFLVRSAKRSMTQELEAMLEVVDPQPSGKLGRRKFDLPVGSFSKEIASGVADVVRMLEQEDSVSSILADF